MVETATRIPELKGVILISAFLSIREVAQNLAGAISRLFIPNIFKNYAIIDKVKSPILFIHGKRDTLIPAYHSVCLYYKARGIKQLALAEEMEHNRAKVQRDIYQPIEDFLMNELLIRDHRDYIAQEPKGEAYSAAIPKFLQVKANGERTKRLRKKKDTKKYPDNIVTGQLDGESKELDGSLVEHIDGNSFVSKTEASYSFDNDNESFIDDKKNLIEYQYDKQESLGESQLMISKYLLKPNGMNFTNAYE